MLYQVITKRPLAGLSLGLGLLSTALFMPLAGPTAIQIYIVQGTNLAAVKAAVQTVGGEITHELGIIHSVGARLSAKQRQTVEAQKGVLRLYLNQDLETASTKDKKLKYSTWSSETIADISSSIEPDLLANILESFTTTSDMDSTLSLYHETQSISPY